MRSDARRYAAAAVTGAALFGAAALAGQGGGLNLPPGAILLTTRAPCPWGTTEFTRADGRMLLPVASSRPGFTAAVIAPATAQVSGHPLGLPADTVLHGSVQLLQIPRSGGVTHSILLTSMPNPNAVGLPSAIRVLACVVD